MQGGKATLRAMEREAFPRKGEQTERADHPVDGPPERFCGPPSGKCTALTQPLPEAAGKSPAADHAPFYKNNAVLFCMMDCAVLPESSSIYLFS